MIRVINKMNVIINRMIKIRKLKIKIQLDLFVNVKNRNV